MIAGSETMTLTNVLAVPGIKCRLFSCRWGFNVDGISTYLNASNYLQLPTGSRVPFSTMPGKHYIVSGQEYANATDDDSALMHARFGHFSSTRINSTLRSGKTGLNHTSFHFDHRDCPACMLNMKRKPRASTSRSTRVYTHFGERICSDTCGPFPESINKHRYAINFYDCHTKYSAVYFMEADSAAEVLAAAQTFIADHTQHLIHTSKPGVPDEWYTDNSAAFTSNCRGIFCRAWHPALLLCPLCARDEHAR